jgi:prefoldin beta subunit
MNDISPQLQNQIAQFQQVQQQLQNVTTQRIQMDDQKKEMERTVVELEKATDDVYRSVGSLLVKVGDKDAVRSEISESIETAEVRIKALERQEKQLREKFQSLQETINKAMGPQ